MLNRRYTSSLIVGYIEKLFIFHIIDADYLYIYQRMPKAQRKGALIFGYSFFYFCIFFEIRLEI